MHTQRLILLPATCLLWFVSISTASAQNRPELSVQTGHALTLTSVSLSADGHLLASGSEDQTVKLWDMATGLELRAFKGHTGAVSTVALSPDGRLLASGSKDKSAKLWDVGAGVELRAYTAHTDAVQSVAFSPDGRTLATGGFDKAIRLWDVATGRELRTLRAPEAVFFVAFSADGKLLATGEGGGVVELWEAATGKRVRTLAAHGESVTALVISPDGKLLATGSADERVKLWDIATGKELRAFSLRSQEPMAGIVLSLAFTPDGQSVSGGTLLGGVKTWRVADGREGRAWQAHPFAAATLIYSPDGRTLTTGGGDQTIRQWDVATGAQIKVLTGRSDPVAYLAVSGDGRAMASSRHDASVKLWRVGAGGVTLRTITHPGVVISLALDERGQLLATGSGGTVKLWDAATGEEARTLAAHDSPVHALAVSGDGRIVASGSFSPVVKLWDAATGSEMHALKAHEEEGRVEALALSRDGRTLVSAGGTPVVKFWDAETGRELRAVNAQASVLNLALSPDGHVLLTGGLDGDPQLWDVKTGELRATLKGERGPLAFSSDSRTFVTGRRTTDSSTVLTLRDAVTGRELRSFTSRYRVTAPAFFCADNKLLVTGSGDTRIIIWDAETGRELAALINVDGTDWVAVTPGGLFDGTPVAWSRILWRFSPALRDVAPVEVFFNEFFYPDLLADLFAGRRPQAQADVAQKDRRQPQVRLALIEPAATRREQPGSIDVRIEVDEAPGDAARAQGSGARDLRLFRNGTLVKLWRGDLLRQGGRAVIEASVPVVAGENRLVAYAFNRDNIKSADASLVVTGPESLRRKGIAYIIATGVNQYAMNPYFRDLKFAVADAEEFAEEARRQHEKLARYERVEVVKLTDRNATKANLLGALTGLSKKVRPEDVVIVYFAGHGLAADGRFYLIPHDLSAGVTTGQTDSRAALAATLAASAVSELELEAAFESVDAAQLIMVIDACNSGQALGGEREGRGPMNSKGLAQLAYEKGMYILTAAQSFQAAQEVSQLGHGLLTYALVEEGLKQGNADGRPKDGRIDVREWLDYATSRVPLMQVEKMKAARGQGLDISFKEEERGLSLERRSGQQPRVFYRREAGTQPLIVSEVLPITPAQGSRQ
ncbi:MAG TPA: caspase family protein [Pyrinomonadaceae bacterium]